MTTKRKDTPLALLIALLLFSVYLLTYSGQIHSGDELSALAVTESVVSGGALTSNQAVWAQYGQGYAAGVQGRYGPEGDLYSKRGILHSLLPAPLFALGGLVPELGRVHLALLMAGVATALTGALVYLTGRRAGYGQAPSVLAALAFGLATPAWPYARYLLGEPFVALGLAAAVYGVVRAREGGAVRWSALAGGGLGMAMGVNLGNLGVVPVAVWAAWRGRRRSAHLAALVVPVALSLALIGVFNAVRFGSPLDMGRDASLQEGFNTPLAISLPALILSPARGVLWFSPLIWLGLAGAVGALWRALTSPPKSPPPYNGEGDLRGSRVLIPPLHNVERGPGGEVKGLGWYVAAVFVIFLVVYGAWYMWWGGYSWGPRFLVPLSPLAALAALPALGRACESGGRWRLGVALVVALAVGVQILGVAVPFGAYEVELTGRYGFADDHPILYQYGLEVLYDWSLSPILGHARLLLQNGVSDVSWFTPDGVDWEALIPLAAFTALLAGLLIAHVRGRSLARREMAALAAGMVALTGWAMIRNAAHPLDPAHMRASALDAVAADATPGDGALIYIPEFTRSILNSYPGFPAAWGMPPLVPPDPDLEGALTAAQRRHERLWVLSWFDALDPDAWPEARLAAEHYALAPRRRADGLWIGYYLMRRGEENWQPAGWELAEAGARLADFATAPDAPQPGEVVRIALRWEATRDVTGDYVILVHLLDGAGRILAQADHAPQNAFRPTWGWQAEETIVDRVALPLPTSLAGGEQYTVRVGLYDWRTPEVRLSGRMVGGEMADALTVMRFRLP